MLGLYCSIVNELQDPVKELIPGYNILLHWVKNHVDVVGNEIADKFFIFYFLKGAFY